MIPDIKPVYSYRGNGSTKTFDFKCLVEDESQLAVFHTDRNGLQVKLTYAIDYTINEFKNPNGGTVTFPIQGSSYSVLQDETAEDKGDYEIISLCLDLPISQEGEYGTSEFLDFKSLEYSLDYLTRLIQIQARQLERSIKTQEGSGQTPDDLINALNQAQVNAKNCAAQAEQSAGRAQQSAIEAEEQATIGQRTLETLEETAQLATENITQLEQVALENIGGARQDALSDITTLGQQVQQIGQQVLQSTQQGLASIDVATQQSLNELRVNGFGVTPSNCMNMAIVKNNLNVALTWVDPADTVINGQTLSTWAGVKIVRRADRYPMNPTDGTLIADITQRNAHITIPLIDTLPNDGKQYYYAAFPYSVNGAVNLDSKNRFGAIVYGFQRNKTDSNPFTRVTAIAGCHNENYRSARMNFTDGFFDYGDWFNTFLINAFRPVMLNYDGTVAYELDPNDHTKKLDGTASDIANTAFNGNAMVGFKQIWRKVVDLGNNVEQVYLANYKVDDDFKCYTHINRDGQLVKEAYAPMYRGSLISGKLRSLSGQAPMNTQAGTTEITYAQANGTHWHTGLTNYWQLRNDVLAMISLSDDSQKVFGEGYTTGGTAASSLRASGEMNNRGMFSGTNANTTTGVKVLFQEHPWGNLWDRIAGWVNVNGTQKIKLTHGTEDGSSVVGYNTDGAGYITIGATPMGTSGGYISGAITVPPYGTFPTMVSGSATTHWCDGFWFNNAQNNYAFVGGYCGAGSLCGSSCANLSSLVSNSYWNFGASLSCIPPL